jgi:hypothetical protein
MPLPTDAASATSTPHKLSNAAARDNGRRQLKRFSLFNPVSSVMQRARPDLPTGSELKPNKFCIRSGLSAQAAERHPFETPQHQ